ncbi:tRNA1(Val) (adenine(37)-N6)-methyltransferase [Glaesserella sp.]|uniref:tRNA1(Val) (adenine(37)-N6)-methyltransferase n=1 Tax=Glaesserella sp. TaxID=2094731 RepID=UPI00359F45E0
MTESKGFQFKQFFIAHDRCAMKVNTDGILLGAVADIVHAERILDLGTGTGLVSLMLAQRTAENVKIVAVELEHNAVEQATQNVVNSPWQNKIQVIQADVMQLNFSLKFDLIVANPPYFEHSLAARNQERSLARAVLSQSHLDWLQQAKSHLSPCGNITFILPKDAAEKLIAQSSSLDLCCSEIWRISSKAGNSPKRMIVTFSLRGQPCVEKQLDIYDSQGQYTEAFKRLTHTFYLKM